MSGFGERYVQTEQVTNYVLCLTTNILCNFTFQKIQNNFSATPGLWHFRVDCILPLLLRCIYLLIEETRFITHTVTRLLCKIIKSKWFVVLFFNYHALKQHKYSETKHSHLNVKLRLNASLLHTQVEELQMLCMAALIVHP